MSGVFARGSGHEQIVFCHDAPTGLRAIIAIYSTALGPSLGGTRFYPYRDENAALSDVLRLSRSMAYKSAAAGLPLGGGKAVILGDPHQLKSAELLRAYGRFIESLSGRYITACDVGTSPEDMDVIAQETGHAVGRTAERGGAGDSAILTALGVLQSLRAAAAQCFGTTELSGLRVNVEGVGKVGHRLVGHLVAEGASVSVCDPDDVAVKRTVTAFPDVRVLPDADALRAADADVYAPCALGGSLTTESVRTLRARLVCGAANNQLGSAGVERLLAERGILWIPDFVANAGGLIQVADERHGFDFERARARVLGIHETTGRLLARAERDGRLPSDAANAMAEERIAAVARGAAIPA
ncbi:Glu/Leu/Phe/Val dehydrogenase dimerization domain-containing protein [Streptomyces sp. NPDC050759]|uniref:Glu/Leu/Phe/Val dehydrogenase dimerization domain-containing protein n=1 Tax=Streptomyces sp. NPDC050759 TaxID=3365635 RepID=UPI0037B8ED6E